MRPTTALIEAEVMRPAMAFYNIMINNFIFKIFINILAWSLNNEKKIMAQYQNYTNMFRTIGRKITIISSYSSVSLILQYNFKISVNGNS